MNKSISDLLSFSIIAIDKPSGPTSHQTSEFVKRILNLKKAGHSGTLDPKVTGVLLIGLNKATRLMNIFLTSPKEYVGIMHLHKQVTKELLQKTIQSFIGKINQLPPVKSAVKRQLRERSIYSFEILEHIQNDILFKVSCQAGTYIRKLTYDIGEALGCGAHMAELRRTKVAIIDESKAVTLQTLKDAYVFYKENQDESHLRKILMPPEDIIKQLLPIVWVKKQAKQKILHGQDVIPDRLLKHQDNITPESKVAIFSEQDQLIATGDAKINSDQIKDAKENTIIIKTKKVFRDL